MIRDNLHTFHLKITTLSPLHIGTGEVYEPTSFVIDGGKLYEFDEVLFYQGLDPADRKLFNQKLNNWMSIIDFYRTRTKEAKIVSKFECDVSKKIESTYSKLKNDDGSKKQNQFQIARTFKNPNTHRVIIPGSSIKGMLDTTFGIYARKVKSNEPRQRLILSDALLLEGKSEVGYAYRRHKNPTKTARSEIPQMVEIISEGSIFVLKLVTEYSFQEIQDMLKQYHDDRRDSIFSQSTNSFIARVGKFCGKEYMVDNGKNVLNTYDKPIATHTVYENEDTFGWIKIDRISQEEYQQAEESIAKQETYYYAALQEKQKEIFNRIKRQQEEKRALAMARQQAKEEEAQKEAEEKAKREAALASMSPLERKIDALVQKNPGTPQSTLLLSAIKDGVFEAEKKEALGILKELMQKENKWKEISTAKNPAKDKAHKRTLEVIEMLRETQ